jgi:hypothetical protein
MTTSGLVCDVVTLIKKDIFGKETLHYKLTVKHTEMRWVVYVKYAKLQSFAKSLWQYWSEELDDEERERYFSLFCPIFILLTFDTSSISSTFGYFRYMMQATGREEGGRGGELFRHAKCFPPKSVRRDSLEEVQEYMNAVLQHSWSSSSATLLEFLVRKACVDRYYLYF